MTAMVAGSALEAVCQQRAVLWTLLKGRVRAVIVMNQEFTDLFLEAADLRRDNERLARELDRARADVVAVVDERDRAVARVAELESRDGSLLAGSVRDGLGVRR